MEYRCVADFTSSVGKWQSWYSENLSSKTLCQWIRAKTERILCPKGELDCKITSA